LSWYHESSPVSELVNNAVRSALLEDADDLQAFAEREAEPVIDRDLVVDVVKVGHRSDVYHS